jgi:hypothetical protein
MSTPSLLPERPEPGPALLIAGINLAMALNWHGSGLVLGDSGVRSLFGLGTHAQGARSGARRNPWASGT